MIWTPQRKEAARVTVAKWHGTPHVDHLAMVHVGIDCIHLVLEVLIDAGIVERREIGRYDPAEGVFSVSQKLVKGFESGMHVERVPLDADEFGQVWIFKTGGRSGHAGIIVDGHLWHALAHRTVTISPAANWQRDVDTAFRIVKPGWKADPEQVVKTL